MKVVVIGGGVSGIASAIALSADHEVEVFEQAERLRTDGNGVLLYPNGTGLLREFGVDPDLLGVPMEALDLIGESGSRLMRLNLAKLARTHRNPVVVTRRGTVLRRLAERLTGGRLHFGKRVTTVEQRGDAVAVSFADGSTAEGDVLVGADGHRSVVRRHLVGGGQAAYLGDATWHGITALRDPLVRGHRIHSLYGERGICVVHPVGDGYAYWAFELPFVDGERVVSPAAMIRSRFAGWRADPMPELLATVTDDDIAVFPHIMHEVREHWSRGPMTLAGDAAHAVPPRLGMGLCQALEDAWVLGHALSGPGTPAARLRAYESARWPRLRRMNGVARMMGRRNLPLPPALLRVVGPMLPMTSYQQAQLRSLSNYLTGDLVGAGNR